MASTRLTNSIRDDILAAATKNAFKKEYAALDKAVYDLSERLYNTLFTTKQRQLIKELPANMFYRCESHKATLKCDGERNVGFSLRFKTRHALSLDWYYHSDVEMTVDVGMLQEARTLNERKKAIDAELDEVKTKINGVLYSVNTIQRLLQIWPEGKQFIPSYTQEAKKALPAVIVKDLNAALAIALGRPLMVAKNACAA